MGQGWGAVAYHLHKQIISLSRVGGPDLAGCQGFGHCVNICNTQSDMIDCIFPRYDCIISRVHNPGTNCIIHPNWRPGIKTTQVEIVMIGIGGKNGNVTVIVNLLPSIFRFPSKNESMV